MSGRETAVYTHGHHESVLRSHRWRTAANSAAYLIGELRPGMSVLDVGCGPGTITADLADLVAPGGRVTAVDAAQDVVQQAAQYARERGLDGAITFGTADVHALDFPDDSFDVVHAHQVLQHVGDPVQALREMRRVCRPGGIVAARDADYAAMAWYPAEPGLEGWLELYRRVARANGGEPDAGRRLLSWATAAGFTEVTSSATAWCYATEEEVAWWSTLWADRTTASSYASIATGGGHATPMELAAVAESWHRWAAAPDAWFSVLNGEILARA
ncbi:methyltransferase domain-containing protein [Streptomyces sp. NPDC006430]|uniref:class I SAM-dependent methyltransferase n=1 Tax=Streptomyces sp. NPDC006430 TaxID=3154299 RepID=UPI0033B361B1